MTATSRMGEDRFEKPGIHLPDAPTPFGAYVRAVLACHRLFLSGMLASRDHTVAVLGVVGKDIKVVACRKPENTFDQERMRAQRADSTMRNCNHKESILDNFRRQLESESQDSGPGDTPCFSGADE